MGTDREAAIGAIVYVWHQRDSEFVIGSDEQADSDRELRDVLSVLGVTDAELTKAGL